jgi:hypothetical protein
MDVNSHIQPIQPRSDLLVDDDTVGLSLLVFVIVAALAIVASQAFAATPPIVGANGKPTRENLCAGIIVGNYSRH